MVNSSYPLYQSRNNKENVSTSRKNKIHTRKPAFFFMAWKYQHERICMGTNSLTLTYGNNIHQWQTYMYMYNYAA